MAIYSKAHKNPQGEQVYKIEKEGKPDKYIVLVDLIQDLEQSEARTSELQADVEGVQALGN